MELRLPCLMLVTDRGRCNGRDLVEAVRAAVSGGVDAVQLREKDLPADELYRLAHELRLLTADRCAFLVNERLDIALAVGADGVHLPEHGLPVEAAVRIRPQSLIVGRSVHSLESAIRAEAAGADYVELGTIFATESKPGLMPAGPELVRETASRLRIPCLPVGGVNETNIGALRRVGAQGVAVVSAILGAPDIAGAVRHLHGALHAPVFSEDAERGK